MGDPYGDIAGYYDMIYGTDIDYEAEAKGLRSILTPPSAVRVLDIACGTASHLIQLAKLGCLGTGIDKSEPMLRMGIHKALAAGLPVRLLTGDMNALDVVEFDELFDAAISCYAFGLENGAREVEETIRHIHPLLDDGGLLVFNLMNAGCGFFDSPGPDVSFDACRSDGSKAVWFYQTVTNGDRQQLTAVYFLDDGGGVSMVTHHLSITLFSLDRALDILRRCGFKTLSVYGALPGLPEFQGDEPAMWLVAEKQ